MISFGKPRIGACYVSSVSIRGLRDYGRTAHGGQLFVSRAHGAACDAKLRRKVLPGRQARARCEHTTLNRHADAFSDLLSQRRLRRAVEFQLKRLGHGLVVRDFCAFLVLFSDPAEAFIQAKGGEP